MPSPEEEVRKTAKELGKAIHKMASNNPTYEHVEYHSGLKQLVKLVQAGSNKLKDQNTSLPRVRDDKADAIPRVKDAIFGK